MKYFYSAQRNTYLTGFCLFLSLVLTRTFYIILDLIHTQEEYAKLKQQTAKQSRGSAVSQDQAQELELLRERLAAAEQRNNDFGQYTFLLTSN
jgi:B-cell receptor-associated protein 31